LHTIEDDIKGRYEEINHTYNFPGSRNGTKYFSRVYNNCELPVKVLHFHPMRHRGRYFRMLCGVNEMNLNLMPERLYNIFKKNNYGYI